ncbi:putative bifunctional diguanylate cyclase/phosphodiesterase [Rhizobium halophytocola]|uniref:Diguanylate cyclase (GGDEF)-like protein n=1 Tax=Rhizobium halophytocola TaxID=735519 RepID=A0ABS4E5V9_9HYPH|nr:EAL domain-containing protein [Rhizobium halophytocola]MBP1853335.1 diguanylate cyclase (GGDEF)-like protein [Rhizobium halophytocola]
MKIRSSGQTGRGYPLRIFVLSGLGASLIMMIVLAFLYVSMDGVDKTASAREIKIATRLINTFRSRIGHEQESTTVWDDAVNHLSSPPTPDRDKWIDDHLGSWMQRYFGHDAAFVVDGEDKPIFASIEGKQVDNHRFDSLRPAILGMAKGLRARLRQGGGSVRAGQILSLGASDYGYFEGHPAILSVKPIIAKTGVLTQPPGEQYLHVAVRRLDTDFLSDLSVEYGFASLHFARQLPGSRNETALPLLRSDGAVFGYFAWRPDRPGLAYLISIMPMLVGMFFAIAVGIFIFSMMLEDRERRNKAQEDRIRYLANHDPLTGLLNRSAYDRVLDRRAATPETKQFALVYLDLDRFKQINDTLGHAAGDAVIRAAASRLGALLPEGAVAGRIGGDEFNALVPFERVEEIEELCAAILEAVKAPIPYEKHKISVGVSMGAATFPVDSTDREELVRKADVALYHSKARGRGQFAMFGPEMDDHVRERAQQERDLRNALADPSQFSVLYQPKYASRGGDIVSVEALVRWHHPERGELLANDFIPLAEKTGLIRELGRHVLVETCRTAADWSVGKVCVNVSPVQWNDPYFAISVMAILKRSNFDPKRLELEITESAWMENGAICGRNINTLRAIGVTVALDDFGVGFSSLNRLREAEVDRVTIDKSFIEGLGQRRGNETIVKAIIDVARSKGLKTTAEGVQTPQQVDFLKALGCDSFQGFLLSRPLPESEIEAMLGGQPVEEKQLSLAS